jgi:hypothetical protein
MEKMKDNNQNAVRKWKLKMKQNDQIKTHLFSYELLILLPPTTQGYLIRDCNTNL